MDKANAFNEYFSRCFNSSHPPITTYTLSGDFECPDEILCSKDEICELLKSLDVNKANGPDGISARMLKSTANAITPSLTKLLNCSIAHGRPPNSWKTALVVPIPKIPRAKNTSNFRPTYISSFYFE